MDIRRLSASFVIALMVAASLHVTAQPAAADDFSVCAKLEAIIINIEGSSAPQDVKDATIATLRGLKRYAGCTL